MAATIGLRTASFAASASVLGFAVLMALTMAITVRSGPDYGPAAASVDMLVELQPPVAPPRVREPPPLATPQTGGSLSTPESPATTPYVPDEFSPAAVSPPGPTTIINPQWEHRPRNLASYYPQRALLRGIEGRVVLDCLVSVRGDLACRIETEAPAGWGFGQAALRISRDHRMVPAQRNGAPVEGRYRMVAPFEVN